MSLICSRSQVSANGATYSVGIRFQPENDRYHLADPAFERAFALHDGSEIGGCGLTSLVGYMNREQSFRVVPATGGFIFSHGDWYSPRARFTAADVITEVPKLAHIGTEKGAKCDIGTWEKGSLFRLVDDLGVGSSLSKELSSIDILVCDDLGSEIADFIAADSASKRVIYIHAKAWPDSHPTSASNLQEVLGQAVKSAAWIHPYLVQPPPNLGLWDQDWQRGDIGNAGPRIRRGGVTGADTWDTLLALIRSPAASREVWVLLGKGPSRNALTAGPPIPARVFQASHLIQSTWGAISASGARFRMFCQP